jgi:hypothetical protein
VLGDAREPVVHRPSPRTGHARVPEGVGANTVVDAPQRTERSPRSTQSSPSASVSRTTVVWHTVVPIPGTDARP